ncbi:cytotoxic T-lymphocyte protein 4-like isoform X2 [Narcine bancroftii]|uniref:cytotoxic T-lymphocyte protein 4-like isoform X2 n=1 Tax=Narcine bancroftii TaxID=1343680 RepID=UPI00383179D8
MMSWRSRESKIKTWVEGVREGFSTWRDLADWKALPGDMMGVSTLMTLEQVLDNYRLSADKFEELKVTQPGLLEVSSTKKPTLDCTHDCEDDVELKLTILKGKDKTTVCSGTIISSNQSIDARGLFHCQMKWLPNKISVIIYGFNSSLVNNYFCKIEKMYPPPYQCGVGDGTVIYINSEDRKCESTFSFGSSVFIHSGRGNSGLPSSAQCGLHICSDN